VPWAAGADDDEGADEEDEAEEAEEAVPDDDPDAEVAEPGVPGAGCEPGLELGRGNEERILHGVGGVLGLAQQGPAVGVQRHRVRVVGLGDAVRVARHDGGDHLPVLHRRHRSSPTAHQAAQTA